MAARSEMPRPSLPFKQVDVFTRVPFKGNPVAVVMQAEGLSTAQMQQIANWTNLSETTFVLPPVSPKADYRVRIFTPFDELPFAGHPTIGTAHALLEAGRITPRDGALVQECQAGLIDLRVHTEDKGERWIAFDLPQPAYTALSAAQLDALDAALGLAVGRDAEPCIVDVGPRWVVAQLRDAQAVLGCRPDFWRMAEQDRRGRTNGVVIFGEHPAGHAARIEVRAFAPAFGINEDPVCGSGNGCVGAFIRDRGLQAHFGTEIVASQGAALGRAGVIRLSLSGQGIQVGGAAITCVDGLLSC